MSDNLIFNFAAGADAEKIKELCAYSPEGAELFTFLCLNSSFTDGSVWCGRDKNGEIKSVIFNDGDRNILSFGKIYPPFLPADKSRIMLYNAGPAHSRAEIISGSEISEIYMLLSGSGRLLFDDSARYVRLLRGINAGFSAAFGIRENGRLVSCAVLASQNKKYALIADVFTDADFRNRGFAAECVNAAAAYALQGGRIPCLKCAEAMTAYYKKAGFIKYEKL